MYTLAIKNDGTVVIDTLIDTKGFNKGVGNMQKSVSGLIGSISKIGAAVGLAFGIKALVDFGKEAINLASDLEEVQNVVDTVFGNMAGSIEEFSKDAITQFGLSELSAKKYSSTMGAMLKSMGFDTARALEMSTRLTGLAGDIASFYNLTSEEAFGKIRSGISGETEPLKQLGINLSVANLEAYALAEGITKSYNAMSQQEQAMLRYNYLLKTTSDAQGDFARTSDSWSNQLKLLTEQFNSLKAILGKTFINVFKPLISSINTVMQKLISFAQTFSNALGKIFGWKYEVKDGVSPDLEEGAGYADDTASGMEEAAKSAKDLKSSLSAIDKLNVISVNASGGSGSGATAGSAVSAAAGEWVEQKSIFEEFESEIDSLYELGEYIGDALIESMQSIDWDSVYEQAEGFGKGLADFLNGLISPELFYETGKTISNSINTAFHSLNSFGKTFEWDEFGSSLAFGLKGFLENWDAELTGETFSTFAKGLLNTMTSFLVTSMEEDTFEDFGQKVVDFICGIDWGGLAWDLLEFFEALTNALTEIPADFATGVGNAIIDKIFGEDANIEIDSDMIQKSLKKSLSKVKGLDIAFMFVDMKNKFEEAKNIFSPITDALSSAKENWKTNLRDFLENDVKPIFGEDLWSEIVSVIKDNPLKAFSEMRDGWKEDISAWWNEDVAPHFDGGAWSLLTGVIASALDGSLYEMIKEWNKDIKKWWNEDVKPWFAEKNWTFDGIKEGLSKAWENAIEAVKGVWNNFADWLNDALTINLEPISILGKTVFGGGEFKLANIPHLASGAVIPPNAPFLAMLGDQRNGTNIEAPLSTIEEALTNVLNRRGDGDIVVQIDGREVFRAVRRQNKDFKTRTGSSAFA